MSLDDFELRDELGSGATGRVLRAVHRPSRTPVAMKTVRPQQRREALGLDRELAALARLEHPHILHLYDHGVVEQDAGPLAPGTHWMALELASGGSLEQAEPSDWDEVEGWLRALLDALGHAHARGVVHRDLKPANIVRCTGDDLRPGLKIADFGLAWALHEDTEGLRRAGSPHYMPPEQITGDVDQLGPWTDLYALGCVMWEWVSGAPPHGWLDIRAALHAHQHSQPRRLRPQWSVPDGLDSLLRAMLSKDVRARPATAAHVRHALDDLHRGFTPSTRPLPVPPSWARVQAAPSTTVLSGAGMGLFALRDPPVVGRDEAQSQLWELLRRVERDGAPRVATLIGPPGHGKRRLGRWLREQVAQLGCARIGRVSGDDTPSRLAHLSRQARRGPVVVDLSGVRLVDEVVVLAAAALLDGRRAGPLLILLGASEDASATEALRDLEGYAPIALPPVSTRILARFLHEHVGLARGPAETVAAGSGGSPGLAVTWARSWVADGHLVSSPEGFRLRPGVPPTPPTSLDAARRAALDGVLATLTAPARLALALGALLGPEVRAAEWLPLLERAGLDRRHSPVRALVRADLVAPTETGWRIPDPLVRAALVHEELPRHGDPARFHELAAQVLAPLSATAERTSRRGRHLLAAGRVEEAWPVLTDAVEAYRTVDWTEVRAIVELLAATPGLERRPADQRYTVRYFHVLAVANLESAPTAVPLLPRLQTLVPEVEEELAHRIHRLSAEIGGLGGGLDIARAALAQTDASSPRMRRVAAQIAVEEERYHDAIALYEAVYEETGGMEIANGLGTAHAMLGDADEAERWFTTSYQIDPSRGLVPLCNLAIVALEDDRTDVALARVHRMLAEPELPQHSERDWFAVIALIIACAAGDDALVQQVRERALFRAHRVPASDVDHALRLVERAWQTAGPTHREVLSLLRTRIEQHEQAP